MRAIMRENEDSDSESNEVPEPAPTLFKTFSGYESDLSPMFFVPMLRYFTRVEVSDGTTLWERGDNPDGIYVVESGVLRAIYDWDNSDVITESMVSGTLSGELSGLANMTRNAKVVTEKDSILWKLSKENWSRFKDEQPALAHRFVELVLKGMSIIQFVRLLLIPVFQLPKTTMIC
jgi:sulfate permease, SulP family